jgi:hypothetical protein
VKVSVAAVPEEAVSVVTHAEAPRPPPPHRGALSGEVCVMVSCRSGVRAGRPLREGGSAIMSRRWWSTGGAGRRTRG